MSKMKIAVAADHGGLNLKNRIKEYLLKKGFQISDFGTDSTDSCDYPDFALSAAEAVASGECDRGIIVCTTGIGVSIVANKVPGIRCALCHDALGAEMTRRHNDANILALGAVAVEAEDALQIVDIFLSTGFEGGRHKLRVDKITEIEKKYSK